LPTRFAPICTRRTGRRAGRFSMPWAPAGTGKTRNASIPQTERYGSLFQVMVARNTTAVPSPREKPRIQVLFPSPRRHSRQLSPKPPPCLWKKPPARWWCCIRCAHQPITDKRSALDQRSPSHRLGMATEAACPVQAPS
jgi:hypothetical protein